jgi:hypothetical protein
MFKSVSTTLCRESISDQVTSMISAMQAGQGVDLLLFDEEAVRVWWPPPARNRCRCRLLLVGPDRNHNLSASSSCRPEWWRLSEQQLWMEGGEVGGHLLLERSCLLPGGGGFGGWEALGSGYPWHRPRDSAFFQALLRTDP